MPRLSPLMIRNGLSLVLGIATALAIVAALIYRQTSSLRPQEGDAVAVHSAIPSPGDTPTPAASPAANASAAAPNPSTPPTSNTMTQSQPDLTVDSNGLSKAVVVINTTQGVVKFKFYTNDAPKTVHRLVELIQSGFYNGLTFHRVVAGFVVQGGDPQGNGTGGSGKKLEAEFNTRKHVEGTLAMARSQDPNSADSQFYITLGTHPHLDRSYTVFGQVTEGMDVAKKLKVGDKMTSVIVE